MIRFVIPVKYKMKNGYFNNEFPYSKALIKMNGLRVTVDIFSTEDESVHETCNVYLVSDDAGEAGVFLITD